MIDPKRLILNSNQRAFADEYFRTGNKKRSAMTVYGASEANAGQFAAQVLKSDKVRAYLASKAYSAAERIEGLAETADSDSVKLAANKDILDRAGYKVPEDVAPPTQGNTYNILFSAEARADVAAIEEIIKARLTGAPPPDYDEPPQAPHRAF